MSRAVLGTMNFGPETSEDDSHAIMDRAHELGVNFFDTANGYGGSVGKGATEEIIGRWFAKGGGRREKTVLATKVYGEMIDWPNGGKLSALNIRQSSTPSLRRLQTDHVDLYQFHHVDRGDPVGRDLAGDRRRGAAGQGPLRRLLELRRVAHRPGAGGRRPSGHARLVSEQSIYNLVVRDVEREVLPAAREYGLGVIPWSPLQGGLLGGVIEKTENGSRRLSGRSAELRRGPPRPAHRLRVVREGARPHPGRARPGVAAAPAGRHRADHRPAHHGAVGVAVRAVDIRLDEAALARLDEIFPGHQTSPEDYAW